MLKCSGLVDFSTTSLPTIHAYTHGNPCSLEEKQLVDRSPNLHRKDVNRLFKAKRSVERWDFCIQCCFMAV